MRSLITRDGALTSHPERDDGFQLRMVLYSAQAPKLPTWDSDVSHFCLQLPSIHRLAGTLV
jgi:hypothetical protein